MMHLHENTGRPLGDEGFVKKPETMLGRMLTPGTPGRPKKATIEKQYGVPRLCKETCRSGDPGRIEVGETICVPR